ncbi:MAG: DNA polymerase domain-containing protein [Rhodothermales bacterium]
MHPETARSDSEIALYGKDETARIVGVHPLLDGAGNLVRVYYRSPEGIVSEDVPFYPFFFLSDIRLLGGFSRNRFRFKQLEGENVFRYVAAFTSWASYWEALRLVERTAGDTVKNPLYAVTNAAQQYLIQSGRTLFKGMTFEELHRLQLDIETYSEQDFSSAHRPEDRILLIALHDNRGWSHVIDSRELSEEGMLRTLVEVIRQEDPDVIEGHNILGFDFPYILERARRYGVRLSIGRDGSVPRTFPSSTRFAERSIDFTAVEIAGRHVIDTYFQVLSYDVVKRDMPAYGLKAAARYFGFASDGRTYIEGGEIAQVWQTDADRVVTYALDDVIETERLARHLSGSTFYLTQIVPMPYGQASRVGPAAKIESLFVREYLRRKESLPQSEWGTQSTGGYTDVFFTGVTGPIVYADVESLYPSIMIHYGVGPKTDTLGLFRELLRQLTSLRMEAKNAMKKADSEEARSELDARQSSYKVLINSFYGQLGFSLALFNDFSEADRVARIGQDLLRALIEKITASGGRVIEVDTDGVLFVPPPDVRGGDAEREFVDELSRAMPAGIRIGFEGRFQKMLSYKKKNYALLDYDGRLRFKGSSLVSRSVERFGRRFVREAIRRLIEEDVDGLHQLFLETRDRILRHDWDSVENFSRTETLKDAVEQYRLDVEKGKRPRAASYELAIERAQRTGQPVRKGDRVSYYVTGQSSAVTAFENCRLADEWFPENPDENTAYYLKRLDEFAQKFESFFLPHAFRQIFSPEDLFGFSGERISLQSHERPVAIATKRL